MAIRLPFRLTTRSAIELSLTLLFALVGLILLLGTTDEYKARKEFNRAMDSYAAEERDDASDFVRRAKDAKPDYDAPLEVEAKVFVDGGAEKPAMFAEALRAYQVLQRRQEARGGKATLPVLVGIAIAELEGVRASAPKPDALAAALHNARLRLEAALATHPGSGDVHVNLATVAMLENDLARCNGELKKVEAVGNISPDALPVIYNLKGLLALKEQRFTNAMDEFRKVEEFRPDWDVPKLNLGAAYAQVIVASGAEARLADGYALELRKVLPEVRKSKSPLLGLICQAYGTYFIHQHRAIPQPLEALRYFGEAEKLGKLPWSARFNQAIAQYMDAHGARKRVAAAYAAPAAELARALTGSEAGPRDKFVASCILGTIENERGNRKEALAHFQRAIALSGESSDPFISKAASRVHTSLLALYYDAGELVKAAECLKKLEGVADPDLKKQLDNFGKHLRSAPTIGQFEAKLDKLFTDCDLRVSAALAIPGSPRPLGPENVTLTLQDELSGTTRPFPFQLNGGALYAVAANLLQGKYRVKLTLSDPFGNRESAASDLFEVDRDPPAISKRKPDAGATVASLRTIEFSVEDSMSGVDLENLRVSLRYPVGSPIASRTLVSGGKYQFGTQEGDIKRYSPVTSNVRAPVPPDKFPKGDYKIVAHIQDTRGKARDIEWTFTLAP